MKLIYAVFALMFSLSAYADQPIVTYDPGLILYSIPSNANPRQVVNDVNRVIHEYQARGYRVVELKNGQPVTGAEKDITDEIAEAAGLEIGR